MLNKTNIRTVILTFISPFFYPVILKIFGLLGKLGFSDSVQNMAYSPSLQTIERGVGKGIKLYVDTTTSKFGSDMIEGKFDDYFFNSLIKLKPSGKTIF